MIAKFLKCCNSSQGLNGILAMFFTAINRTGTVVGGGGGGGGGGGAQIVFTIIDIILFMVNKYYEYDLGFVYPPPLSAKGQTGMERYLFSSAKGNQSKNTR